MTLSYSDWAAAYPQAAAALAQVLAAHNSTPTGATDGSEAALQQRLRMDLAAKGVLSWRNNVGSTKAKCLSCGAKQQPVRYGLANDSAKLNEQIKSADLILGIPRVITEQHLGRTILQFGSIEVKQEGWKFTGKGREAAQAAWAALINSHGGHAQFSTGQVTL